MNIENKTQGTEQEMVAAPEKKLGPQTERLDILFGALAKAQAEMEIASLNCTNPFFKSKYADLASVVKASRPCLAKNGLAVVQQILTNAEGQPFLHTKLCHVSGQWIESNIRITPPKPDVQTLGAYISYLRRYCYAALVGVVVAEEDDDAESISQHKTPSLPEKITPEQLQVLSEELEGCPDMIEQMKMGLKIKSLSDMPQEKFEPSLKRIRQIKHERSLHA